MDEMTEDEFRDRVLDLAEAAEAMGNTTRRLHMQPSLVAAITRRLLELLPPADSDMTDEEPLVTMTMAEYRRLTGLLPPADGGDRGKA